MDLDFEIFDGKSFKDLCKDIYTNQSKKKEQIETFIGDLRPLIKNVNDAMVVVPLIKDYLSVGNTNDEHLVKLASIIQRLITAQNAAGGAGGVDALTWGLSDDEKKALMDEIKAVKEANDTIEVKKIEVEKP